MLNRNAEIVRKLFEALERGDIEAVVSQCDPEVEVESLLLQVEGGSYRGHAGVRRFFSDQLEVWEAWKPHPERVEANGEVALVTGKTQLRGKGSGVEVTLDWAYVMRLRGGKLLWGKVHSDHAEAEREYEALQG